MAGYVRVRMSVCHHPRAQPHEPVDHVVDSNLVPGDGGGGDDDGVTIPDLYLAVIVVRHAHQP